ncbi:hypothetical protein PAECIP111893_00433 [Paenibacillus plantiphilus]|uniref:Pyridine nucleotide transhydrogenase n=1 Tax=Paenibacillus plantiphilus TaxID=2905650 RepID=A0ABN8G406_9BACL|nr:pyridine nucleotide transhydrogenase [Paenibacillus plantiphilus]CAH1193320.1 hypothetical protein PAECIP111893_00433 [Paenibacillus plantiphilus]
MTTALIGFTGFVGSILLQQTSFDALYNSKNIEEIQGKHYSQVVCAGAPAVKWKANQDPEADWDNLSRLMSYLSQVQADEFILISTVDVYQKPIGVDEDSAIAVENAQAYGKHRYFLEEFVRKQFSRHFIVRLPGLFGKGLKKNFIFDLMNENCLHLTDYRSVFQFYDMSRLWNDLSIVREAGVGTINFATEPVSAEEVATVCFDRVFRNETDNPSIKYDMHSKHASLFEGYSVYMTSKQEVLTQIKTFQSEELRKS